MSKKKNFLDLVFQKNNKVEWNTLNKTDRIQLVIKRDSMFEKIVRFVFKTPPATYVDLDDLGSFVFLAVDGEKDVGEVADKVKEKFGKKAEPLYERLVQYLKILSSNGFIKEIKRLEK